MYRHRGPRWGRFGGPASYGNWTYGWPGQYGGWYGRRSLFGSLASAAVTVALIALAVSWWRGRRQPFSW